MHLKRKKRIILKTLILAGMLLLGVPVSVKAEENLIPITEKEFPDDNFRLYIREQLDKDKDGFLSNDEIKCIDSISVSGMNIEDLTGIEYFTRLDFLNCSKNKIKRINLENNRLLDTLYCYSNLLEELNVSENYLIYALKCQNNQLYSLDLDTNYILKELDCSNNHLSSLGLNDKAKLQKVKCSNNAIESLDLTNSLNLIELNCAGNRLTSLDVSDKWELKDIDCGANFLTCLDLSSCNFIETVFCHNNQITQLFFPKGKELRVTQINLYSNMLTELDTTNMPKLEILACDHNCLLGLDLSQNPNLKMVSGGPQKPYIETGKEKVIDLLAVKGVDPSKISNLENATLKDGKLYISGSPVNYDYKLIDSEKLSVCIETAVHTHSLSHVERKEATCGEDGNREYYACTCGEWFWDIEGTEQIYDKQEIVIGKTGEHIFDTGLNISESTCKEHGITIYTCTVCHLETIEHLPLKDHKEMTEVLQATPDRNGVITCVCKNCNSKLGKTIIYSPVRAKVEKGNPSYTGNPLAPGFIVKDVKGNEILKNHYEVVYPDAVKVGSYRVKIIMKGIYGGTLNGKYDVLPPRTKLLSVESGKEKASIRWQKQTRQVNGYEIQYSTDKKFSKLRTKTCTINSNKMYKKNITGLKSKKLYFVRIRTFKTIGKKTYYSTWSPEKRVQPK